MTKKEKSTEGLKKSTVKSSTEVKEKKPNRPNPHGANQHVVDPRQLKTWNSYVNPKSKTFGNAYQSAVKAGYTIGTAKQITVEPWFLEKLRRLNLLGKAEKVLEETLEMPIQIVSVGGHGEDKEEVVTTSPALVKIKQDTAKFLADRLGKHVGYSTRQEIDHTTGGESLKADLSPEEQSAVDSARKKAAELYEQERIAK